MPKGDLALDWFPPPHLRAIGNAHSSSLHFGRSLLRKNRRRLNGLGMIRGENAHISEKTGSRQHLGISLARGRVHVSLMHQPLCGLLEDGSRLGYAATDGAEGLADTLSDVGRHAGVP